jgi:metal-sulfur cluster biosynthetic enzyme
MKLRNLLDNASESWQNRRRIHRLPPEYMDNVLLHSFEFVVSALVNMTMMYPVAVNECQSEYTYRCNGPTHVPQCEAIEIVALDIRAAVLGNTNARVTPDGAHPNKRGPAADTVMIACQMDLGPDSPLRAWLADL